MSIPPVDISEVAVDNAASYLDETEYPQTAAMLRALRTALTASEKDAEEYRWLKAHPDEFSSAVNDAYGQWGGDEAQEFADILGDEIKHQRSKV